VISEVINNFTDLTLHLRHGEQLPKVIRFVDVDFVTKKVVINESFLGYIKIHDKDKAILKKSHGGTT
jgi:hypothetical protein